MSSDRVGVSGDRRLTREEGVSVEKRESGVPAVLFVCGDPLLPLYGGGPVRIFALVDHFQRQGFRVDVVARNHGARLNRQIRGRFDRVWILRDPEGGVWGPGQLTRMRRALTSRIPWFLKRSLRRWVPRALHAESEASPRNPSFILRKIDPALCELGGRAAREGRHDAVISEFAWTARALDQVPEGVLRIIDTIDIQHLRHPRAQAAGRELPHHRCTREEEVQELERADLLLAIQKEEADVLKSLCPAKRVVVAEHALKTRSGLASPPPSQMILFVGNLYDPNVSGIKNFIEHAWPTVQKTFPESELIVCGRVCEAFESSIRGVRFLGVVPELKRYYADAAVVINPVPYGSGLNIKSVEALSFGKCVVGTPSAFRGIRNDAESAFEVVPSGADMADPIIRLLREPKRRADVERKTREFANRYLTPEKVYSDLVGAIRSHAVQRAREAQRSSPGSGGV